jgi:hypothetical protein
MRDIRDDGYNNKKTTIIIKIIKSIIYYLCAESTAARPITDRAQGRYK